MTRTTDEAFAELARKLDGRAPEFVETPELGSGRVLWDDALLPRVYVSSDVWNALYIRGVVASRIDFWLKRGVISPAAVDPAVVA